MNDIGNTVRIIAIMAALASIKTTLGVCLKKSTNCFNNQVTQALPFKRRSSVANRRTWPSLLLSFEERKGESRRIAACLLSIKTPRTHLIVWWSWVYSRKAHQMFCKKNVTPVVSIPQYVSGSCICTFWRWQTSTMLFCVRGMHFSATYSQQRRMTALFF